MINRGTSRKAGAANTRLPSTARSCWPLTPVTQLKDGFGRRSPWVVPDMPRVVVSPESSVVGRQKWVDDRKSELVQDRSKVLYGSALTTSHADVWEARHWTSRMIHHLSSVASHAVTALATTAIVIMWAVIGFAAGFPDWWQTILYSTTGSVTLVMIFVLQHSQERHTSATQRKLDELIRASSSADNALIAVEETDQRHLQALADLNFADRERAVTDT